MKSSHGPSLTSKTSQLAERIKELNCQHKFAELIEQKNIDLSSIYTELTNIIPPALRYPEYASAKVVIDAMSYASKRHRKCCGNIKKSVNVNGKARGYIEIGYAKEIIDNTFVPFLKEEENLLFCLCERLGRVIQRYSINEELEQAKVLIENQYKVLEKKNIALSEIIAHLEYEKKKINDQIKSNINIIIIPLLNKMKTDPDPISLISLVVSALDDITSSFGDKIQACLTGMTPREIEICNYLRNGMSSKEIADILSLSPQTINKHRFHIRKKLGIDGEKKNIVTFLQSIE